ncbi:MAG: hypothetical protein LJE67_06960 [Salaquimonas sp.]|nr:hypothetical protein [Salaquimonas sp.]
MPSKPFRFASVVLVSALLALTGCSSTATSTNAGSTARPADPVQSAKTVKKVERFNEVAKRARATRTGEVYLLRGLMDIFSRGMDVMGAKLNRAGVYAMVDSYTNWQEIANVIVKRSRQGDLSYPIVIMGHSLGGNDAPKMATYLGQRGIKVAYVVTFDPTESPYVGKNISRVINFYLPHDKNNRIRKGSGFNGTLKNISMAGHEEITHTTIEKNVKLQNEVIGRIMSMTKKKR